MAANFHQRIVKVKVKVQTILEKTVKAQKGEYRHSPTLPSWALDGVDGQRHTPAALPLAYIRYTLCRRLGGPQGRSGRVAESICPQRDSIPEPSNPWLVAIPTELLRPPLLTRPYTSIIEVSKAVDYS